MRWSWRLLLALITLAVLLTLQALLSRWEWGKEPVRIANLCGIYIILAVSLNLINGFTGQFSLSHGGFMAIGAYTAALTTHYGGAPVLAWLHSRGLTADTGYAVLVVICLILGALAAALAGIIVGLPTFRLRGDYLAIATLGFGEIVRVIIINLKITRGALGLDLTPPGISLPNFPAFFWIFALVLLTALVIRNLVGSSHGRALVAVREDELAAEAIGISSTRYKVIAFAIGALFAGVAGTLFAHSQGSVYSDDFGFMKSIMIVVMVVLGGMGSLIGSVLAAVVLTVMQELMGDFLWLQVILYAVAIAAVLLTYPRQRHQPVRFFTIAGVALGGLIAVMIIYHSWLEQNLSQFRMVPFSALLVVLMLTRPQGLLGGKELTWRALSGLRRRPPRPLRATEA